MQFFVAQLRTELWIFDNLMECKLFIYLFLFDGMLIITQTELRKFQPIWGYCKQISYDMSKTQNKHIVKELTSNYSLMKM